MADQLEDIVALLNSGGLQPGMTEEELASLFDLRHPLPE